MKHEDRKKNRLLEGRRLGLLTKFLISYLRSTFACLQMYIASTAATARTAIENIVNIITNFLSQSFVIL